ncbi:hypothetical protein OF83DRAFT_913198 [Amylostereum chailletii]|nr:hypothetical protein OF83DRAFT_913198 [Amylostereum chailletii]
MVARTYNRGEPCFPSPPSTLTITIPNSKQDQPPPATMLALFKLVYTAFSVSFWAMAAFVRLVFWILSAVFFQPAYYLTQQYPVISISFILLWYLRDLKPDPSFLATVESMDATNVSLSSLSDATAALPQAIGTSPPKPKPLDTRRRLPNTADRRPAFFMGCLEGHLYLAEVNIRRLMFINAH